MSGIYGFYFRKIENIQQVKPEQECSSLSKSPVPAFQQEFQRSKKYRNYGQCQLVNVKTG